MSTVWIRHAPGSVSVVRRRVQVAFVRAGLTDDQAYDAALIASELVGNAVRHAPPLPSGRLTLRWTLDAEGYTISVTDGGGPHEISAGESGACNTCGRGLMIVAALSSSWGSFFEHDSTTVWARGSYQSSAPAHGSVLSSG